MQNGQKVSVWEYYDYNKKLQIKVNHTTGKVYYLQPDTADYVISEEGKWTRKKLRFYPTPMTGYRSFSHWLNAGLEYPLRARRDGTEGEVVIMFEVDTVGTMNNFQILKDMGVDAADQVLRRMQAFEGPWIPARINGIAHPSRFVVCIHYFINSKRSFTPDPSLPLATALTFGFTYYAGPTGRPSYTDPGPFYSLPKALASKQSVHRLNLINQNWTNFPPDIFKLEHLKVLDLERNAISEVPREIAKLQKLKELYLPLNQIQELPAEIANLKNLTYLGLASNQFTKFPRSVYNVPNLEGLDLANNQLASIPPGISNLKDLTLISLAHNNLTSLPEDFFELKKLAVIYLNDNHFDQATVDRINATFRKAKIVWSTNE